MSSALTFKILEDIAKDLSGDEITFPTFLDITFQVRTALKDPNLSVEMLSKLIGAEPLMSTKIIRMANSVAFFFLMIESAQVSTLFTYAALLRSRLNRYRNEASEWVGNRMRAAEWVGVSVTDIHSKPGTPQRRENRRERHA